MKKLYIKTFLPILFTGVVLLTACGKEPASSPQSTLQPSSQPTAVATPMPTPSLVPTAEPTQVPSTPTPTPDPNLINITEENYAQLVHEISQTPELYFEKEVHIQGMYLMEKPDGLGITTHFVYRLGPDTHAHEPEADDSDEGIDLLGLQIVPPEDFSANDGDWINVRGIVRIVSVDGYPFLALDEAQVTIDNDHRGSETIDIVD